MQLLEHALAQGLPVASGERIGGAGDGVLLIR